MKVKKYQNVQQRKFHISFLFKDISFNGRMVLDIDIGGGAGLFRLYAAFMGARFVVCLEPELQGSTKGYSDKLRILCAGLPKDTIVPQSDTFQECDPGDQIFDIILLHNSINHLNEQVCLNLQHSKEA